MLGEITPIPADIAGAVNKVMKEIKTLGKDDKNAFGKYDFVSTDKFLAAVNPLCGEAGLIIVQNEDDCSVEIREMEDERGAIKKKAHLSIRFSFILAHTSGATWGPLIRTIMVPANGAQAFGSAQSYALKQFLRSLFQISTGDRDDADLGPDDELPARGRAQPKREERRREEPKPEKPKRDRVENEAALSVIRIALELASTTGEVNEVVTKNAELLDTVIGGEELREEATAKWKLLRKLEKEAAE